MSIPRSILDTGVVSRSWRFTDIGQLIVRVVARWTGHTCGAPFNGGRVNTIKNAD